MCDVPKVLTAGTGWGELIPAGSGPTVGPRIGRVTYILSGVEPELGNRNRAGSWEDADIAEDSVMRDSGQSKDTPLASGCPSQRQQDRTLNRRLQVTQNQENRERRQASVRAREEATVPEKPG